MRISTHTPARGVTGYQNRTQHLPLYFNPHSRKGSDEFGGDAVGNDGHFNPHSRKGSDMDLGDKIKELRKFQPTLPQGE